MKQVDYFSHDYHARHDPKLVDVQIRHGMAGIGCYWCIIEMLYEQANAMRTHYERIAFELRVDADMVRSVINDFDLFVIDGDVFGSKSVAIRLSMRQEKSKKAALSAEKRWSTCERNANASQIGCERNALNESETKPKAKVNEIKTSKASGNTQSIPVTGGDPSSHSPESARSSSSHSASPKNEIALYFELHELFKPHKPSDITTLKDICRQIAKKHSNGNREAVFAEVIENALRSKEVGKRPLALFVSKMKPYGYVPLG